MQFIGTTITGDGRGKELGFPTVNIHLQTSEYEEGVFAVLGEMNTMKFEGVAHFGPRPTFKKNELSIEIHIFDFSQEVSPEAYIEFQTVGEKIRDIQKFTTREVLVSQIQTDITMAKKILL